LNPVGNFARDFHGRKVFDHASFALLPGRGRA
jgi:hypothetical protein